MFNFQYLFSWKLKIENQSLNFVFLNCRKTVGTQVHALRDILLIEAPFSGLFSDNGQIKVLQNTTFQNIQWLIYDHLWLFTSIQHDLQSASLRLLYIWVQQVFFYIYTDIHGAYFIST